MKFTEIKGGSRRLSRQLGTQVWVELETSSVLGGTESPPALELSSPKSSPENNSSDQIIQCLNKKSLCACGMGMKGRNCVNSVVLLQTHFSSYLPEIVYFLNNLVHFIQFGICFPFTREQHFPAGLVSTNTDFSP